MKSVRTSTIWRSLIHHGTDRFLNQEKRKEGKGGRLKLVRLPPSLGCRGHLYLLSRKSRSSFPSFLLSLLILCISGQSAELFLVFASSVVKSRGNFGEAAETFTRHLRARLRRPRSRVRSPRSVQSVSSVVVCSFSYSCVFVSIRGWLRKS